MFIYSYSYKNVNVTELYVLHKIFLEQQRDFINKVQSEEQDKSSYIEQQPHFGDRK